MEGQYPASVQDHGAGDSHRDKASIDTSFAIRPEHHEKQPGRGHDRSEQIPTRGGGDPGYHHGPAEGWRFFGPEQRGDWWPRENEAEGESLPEVRAAGVVWSDESDEDGYT